MKHLTSFFGTLIVVLSLSSVQAQLPFGSVAQTLSLPATKLLTDPTRGKVYALLPSTNAIAVIDVDTLTVSATVTIGSDPADMAISPDGNTLYVANFLYPNIGVTALDLNTLTVGANYPLPSPAKAVAAGLDGRVYAFTNDGAYYEIDTANGGAQTTFNGLFTQDALLQTSLDGKTLYTAVGDLDTGGLESYDVSAATPVVLKTNNAATIVARQLVISHNGNYLCASSGGGNIDPANPYASTYETFLYSTADLSTVYGRFDNGQYPGPLAFSGDDTLVYQTVSSANILQVFSTQSFAKLNEANLPNYGTGDYAVEISSVALDESGTYLFIAENEGTMFQVIVIATGTGTLVPPLPTVNIEGESDGTAADNYANPIFTFTRTGNLSKKLVVKYSVAGSGRNGLDYNLITGTIKIKANKSSANLVIVPTNQPTDSPVKKVKLKLLSEPTYRFGDSKVAKIKFQSDAVIGK